MQEQQDRPEPSRRPHLADLLSQEASPEQLPSLPPEEQQQQRFLQKMRELARGLRDSEYWDLVSLVLIEQLEEAKSALERESTPLERMRFCQGEAHACREAVNFMLELAKDVVEDGHGKEE